ncbi:MAG TPA: tryptophan synthase subunit beta [candidate division Zixibacteria bacterium]|nr:tryptophan synthase subunit beta [candidate division Zixibacteria bacterium]MDD4918718.1 tryptophan synthase subunit beta [candidate division Zixibacteria bacterium]MDM7973937.1 tryptophan synthase subunit beta [candidate division Zixibacteria bacterium]HOD65778.1 tryptophan synthase subunit beta [candidate division Zixibacteria bacterium]HPC11252.1 tryptophan synthase subunit beta [candidate division Zixibacteria bacterium]
MPRRTRRQPDRRGRFGPYGGRYVPETVMAALDDLERAYRGIARTPEFRRELGGHLRDFVGRPTPLYFAERFSERVGRAVYFKREDLNHTGAHKINNVLGQILLARRMGKRRVIAETGAGQHGLATAAACARFGLTCIVYMGAEDIVRQKPNVEKMALLGAAVVPVESGSRTLKDATSEALRDWVTNVRDTFYVIGSVVGPHPYPMIVRDFQSVIGRETLAQCRRRFGALPDALVACVGGGSNAIGLFAPFLRHDAVRLFGVEAAGLGLRSGRHAATLTRGKPGVLHGTYSYLLYDRDGQVVLPHSVSAGLDYPGVGPEHAFLKDAGRVEYVAVTDREALAAFRLVSRLEGIIPALETAHALAWMVKAARRFGKSDRIVVNLSGRGDKDMAIVGKAGKTFR